MCLLTDISVCISRLLKLVMLRQGFEQPGLVEDAPACGWGWNWMILKAPFNPNHSMIL